MKENVGTVDRLIRIALGIVIIGLGAYYGSWLGLIGIIPLATAATGFCPAYLPFGVNTAKGKK